MGNLVEYRSEGGVGIIELNDPPANTYTYDMNRELDEAILQARMDDDVYVIVLRGAGEKFFCAGANIKMLSEVTPGFKYFFCLHANETLNRLEQTPKLVIAALNGHTVGGGLEIAMAADLRIAKKGGGKVGLPEVNLGVLPGTGGTQRLARLIGASKALDLCLTGRTIGPGEAMAMGMVDRLADNALDGALVLAGQISIKPPKAVAHIKKLIRFSVEKSLSDGLRDERTLFRDLMITDDANRLMAEMNNNNRDIRDMSQE